jgi:predicted transcriptional regulator
MRIQLADREAEIMAVLWEHGPSTVAEVKDRLGDDLAYTTVLTVLRKLEAKRYVGHGEEGRAHRYKALIAHTAARSSALRDLSTKLFNGSAALLMTHLVSDEKLSDSDICRLQALLEQRSKRSRS